MKDKKKDEKCDCGCKTWEECKCEGECGCVSKPEEKELKKTKVDDSWSGPGPRSLGEGGCCGGGCGCA